MFEWFFDLFGCRNANINFEISPPPENFFHYSIPNEETNTKIHELKYDNLRKHYDFKPGLKLGEYTYMNLIREDMNFLLKEEDKDLKKLDEFHIAIKWVLAGAFFASIASYKNADLAYYEMVDKIFLEQKPNHFFKSGSNLFMIIKWYYSSNKPNMLIHQMINNHQEMMNKVDIIALKISQNLYNKVLNINSPESKEIIIQNVNQHCPERKNQETLIIEEIDKKFSFPSSISNDKANKLNTALTFAKLLLTQILFERQSLYKDTYNNDNKIIIDATNNLFNSLKIQSPLLDNEALNPPTKTKDYLNTTTIFKNEKQKDSAPLEIINLLNFMGPDDDQNGNAIKVINPTTQKEAKTTILDWIEIIENKDVKQNLLSQTIIQNIQSALLDMAEKISHAKKINWLMPFNQIEEVKKDDYSYYEQEYRATPKLEHHMFYGMSAEDVNNPIANALNNVLAGY